MKIKFTLLLFLLLVTFSAIANYNLPKEKLKKVKLQLNNKIFELCVPKGYMFLTSSLKKHTFYNLLINNILYLCVT